METKNPQQVTKENILNYSRREGTAKSDSVPRPYEVRTLEELGVSAALPHMR